MTVSFGVYAATTQRSFATHLKDALDTQKGRIFTLETLRKFFPGGLAQLDDYPDAGLFWFEPPSLSPRIVNQYAVFSVIAGVERRHCDWLSREPAWYC